MSLTVPFPCTLPEHAHPAPLLPDEQALLLTAGMQDGNGLATCGLCHGTYLDTPAQIAHRWIVLCSGCACATERWSAPVPARSDELWLPAKPFEVRLQPSASGNVLLLIGPDHLDGHSRPPYAFSFDPYNARTLAHQLLYLCDFLRLLGGKESERAEEEKEAQEASVSGGRRGSRKRGNE